MHRPGLSSPSKPQSAGSSKRRSPGCDDMGARALLRRDGCRSPPSRDQRAVRPCPDPDRHRPAPVRAGATRVHQAAPDRSAAAAQPDRRRCALGRRHSTPRRRARDDRSPAGQLAGPAGRHDHALRASADRSPLRLLLVAWRLREGPENRACPLLARFARRAARATASLSARPLRPARRGPRRRRATT